MDNKPTNPWLQELPDPITRVSWDNYLTMSAADAKELGIKNWHVANGGLDGDYAEIQVGDVKLKVPVLIQPGQAKGSVGLAFGYGRKAGMKKEMQVGVNAYALYNNLNPVQPVASIKKSRGYSRICLRTAPQYPYGTWRHRQGNHFRGIPYQGCPPVEQKTRSIPLITRR